ncbi:hypothetical protein OPV22_034803 [Ensete ventricosum]|uniref:Secretory carrier-associated membrane protein n=1 Tax=Ensete ventricosum TaxID=4639 RepID=A0AAV8PJI8_ENSVE|nr:hypothetical protein OPV22_034803 [Ensete ventricosum]
MSTESFEGILAAIDTFSDHALVGIFYLVGFGLFCLETLISLWVLQRVYIFLLLGACLSSYLIFLKVAKVQERKWTVHGEPYTSKLTVQSPPVSISGKRKQKLFMQLVVKSSHLVNARGQKEVPEKGLVTMQDVEMAVAEGKKSKRKSSKPSTSAPVDAMVE